MGSILIIYLIIACTVSLYALLVRHGSFFASLVTGLIWPITVFMLTIGGATFAIANSKNAKRAKIEKELYEMTHYDKIHGNNGVANNASDSGSSKESSMPLNYTVEKGHLAEYEEKEKSSKKEDDIKITPYDERPLNTDLTEEEWNELDLDPLVVRDFIFSFSKKIAADCIVYFEKGNDIMDDEFLKKLKQQIYSNLIAENAVALFMLVYHIFKRDMKKDEWDMVYDSVSYFWHDSYKKRVIDGWWKEEAYKSFFRDRLKIYSEIFGYHSVSNDLKDFLSEYIDYHCQLILSLLLTHEISPYIPSKDEHDIPTDKGNILYQTTNFAMYRIDGSITEPRIKSLLSRYYNNILGTKR